MQSALNDYPFLGVKNNRLYLKKTLASEAFIKGDTWTNFIDKNPEILENCQKRNVENELGILCLNSEAISKTKLPGGSFDEGVPPILTYLVSYKALGIKKMKNNLKINNELIDQYKISNIENVQTVTSGEISTNIEIVDILDKKIIFFKMGIKSQPTFINHSMKLSLIWKGSSLFLVKIKNH